MCVTDEDAIANSPTRTGRAPVHRAACHEQTRRVAPPYLSVYILAGQLVKHLQALPHGLQLAAAAEVVTSYAVVKVR